MNLRKSILPSLLLAVMALFLAGCGCEGGQCPFKKIFGGKSAESKQPAGETAPAPAPETK
jgi:hypothetical protein